MFRNLFTLRMALVLYARQIQSKQIDMFPEFNFIICHLVDIAEIFREKLESYSLIRSLDQYLSILLMYNCECLYRSVNVTIRFDYLSIKYVSSKFPMPGNNLHRKYSSGRKNILFENKNPRYS